MNKIIVFNLFIKMDYSTKKIPELKQLCKDKSLSPTGKKTILIERLEAYDLERKIESERFKVFIKTLMGSFYTIYLDRSATILELKQKIEEKNGCPVKQQLLYFRKYKSDSIVNPTCISEIKLEDEMTLSDYNINKESTINLQVRLRTV